MRWIWSLVIKWATIIFSNLISQGNKEDLISIRESLLFKGGISGYKFHSDINLARAKSKTFQFTV